jgi:hypothetical protein
MKTHKIGGDIAYAAPVLKFIDDFDKGLKPVKKCRNNHLRSSQTWVSFGSYNVVPHVHSGKRGTDKIMGLKRYNIKT